MKTLFYITVTLNLWKVEENEQGEIVLKPLYQNHSSLHDGLTNALDMTQLCGELTKLHSKQIKMAVSAIKECPSLSEFNQSIWEYFFERDNQEIQYFTHLFKNAEAQEAFSLVTIDDYIRSRKALPSHLLEKTIPLTILKKHLSAYDYGCRNRESVSYYLWKISGSTTIRAQKALLRSSEIQQKHLIFLSEIVQNIFQIYHKNIHSGTNRYLREISKEIRRSLFEQERLRLVSGKKSFSCVKINRMPSTQTITPERIEQETILNLLNEWEQYAKDLHSPYHSRDNNQDVLSNWYEVHQICKNYILEKTVSLKEKNLFLMYSNKQIQGLAVLDCSSSTHFTIDLLLAAPWNIQGRHDAQRYGAFFNTKKINNIYRNTGTALMSAILSYVKDFYPELKEISLISVSRKVGKFYESLNFRKINDDHCPKYILNRPDLEKCLQQTSSVPIQYVGL